MKSAPITPAHIHFADGEPPRSPRYGDLYHPRDGAARQARAVFLAGNGLPARWAGRERFTILETGFGLGNNFLATWQAWRDDPARCERLNVVSIDAHPPRAEDLARAHAASPWPELAAQLIAHWPALTPNLHPLHFDDGRVQLLLGWGEELTVLRELRLAADAVYLDGFAPSQNWAMWRPELLLALARRCATGATAATWSVAGELRRDLAKAGFEVRKRRAEGGKRAVSQAVFAPRWVPLSSSLAERKTLRQALVIGAGLAGACAARALARQGWRVTVLDRHAEPAAETSGNPAGIFHGTLHRDDGVHARLFRAAALFAQREFARDIAACRVSGEIAGLLRLTHGDRTLEAMQATIAAQGLPPSYVRALDAGAASAAAGVRIAHPAWLFAGGGWVAPGDVVRAALATPGVEFRGAVEVAALRDDGRQWQALSGQGDTVAAAEVVVLANAAGAMPLAAAHGWAEWPLTRRRGQVSGWHGAAGGRPIPRLPRLPVAGGAYAIGLPDGGLVCGGGASLFDGDEDPAPRAEDDEHHFTRLAALTGLKPPADRARRRVGRVGWRLGTPNRLPIVGPVPLADRAAHPRLDQPRLLARRRGLFVLTALGSRGLTLAPLVAELLAAQVGGSPWPLEQDLADALDPGRFLVRRERRRFRDGLSELDAQESQAPPPPAAAGSA